MPAAKLVLGIVIIVRSLRWRSFGIGLIVSIPMVLLLSVGLTVGFAWYACTHMSG